MEPSAKIVYNGGQCEPTDRNHITPMTTPIITLNNISKAYGDVTAVDHVSLEVIRGEIVVLLGPSGCGKTTTLRVIAGLEQPDSGEVLLNGEVVAGKRWVEPEKRQIGLVFQDYALFPHLTVEANVNFGLRGWSKGDKAQRVNTLLDLVGLPNLGKRMPHELSGGQQQRVALARALAPKPDVILLDEPFSNLDAALRTQVRMEVRDILKETGTSAVFVTHDQEEALSLSDQVAVMFDGKVAQFGPPQQVYVHPQTPRVAAFVGEANFLPGQATGHTAASPLGQVHLDDEAHGPVNLMIRPEWLRLSAQGKSGTNGAADTATAATVTRIEFFGHDQRVHLQLDDAATIGTVIARLDSAAEFTLGDRVLVTVAGPAQPFPQVQ